ncbi:FecR family protein [Chitinophaga agrisoli]|nr:FecR domain-containing protein [Chitinophaga agrisoli]
MLRYWYYNYEMQDLPELTEEQINQVIALQPPALPAVKVRRFPLAWLAAASLLLLIGTAAFFLLYQQKQAPPAQALSKPIVPGGNKAVLTLASGETIVLDSVQKGALARQGNVRIVKTANGLVQYQFAANEATAGDHAINRIATPAGGQYQLVLSDGTRVWLNASSAIHFPASFQAGIREVELTGEAYFEVAANAASPFVVNAGGQRTEVLGTHFNINDYKDNGNIIITLLEGKIRVGKDQQQVTLAPGQQALVQDNHPITVNENANIEMAVAWKNGLFKFNDTPLEDVMLQLSRWYDVDVSYEGQMADRRFSGEITRNAGITEVLAMLQLLKVKFTIKDNGGRKTIIVMPD